jgi:cell division protein FtsW
VDNLRRYRITIITIVLMLMAVGLVMIYNVTGIRAHEYYGSSLYFLNRHVFFICLGLIAALIILGLDTQRLRRFSKPAMLIALFLLALVLIPRLGYKVGGARRWFKIGAFNFQPSEFAKIALILYLGDFLARKGFEIENLKKGFLPAFFVTLLCAGLILLQPDLGTGLLVFSVAVFMIFAGGVKIRHLLFLALLAIPALVFLILLKPYRMRRIMSFLNPWQYSQDAGYQLVQSLIALGSGNIFGVGLGRGEQKLYYLPAAHTDFIFSIIGEELGFIGTSGIVVLFILFIYYGAKLAFGVHDQFRKLVILGLVSLISLQAIIHIGTSTGSIPTKGLPLPFISYGGSSLVFNMIAVAIMLNVSRVNSS